MSAMREALQWFVDYRKALPNKHTDNGFNVENIMPIRLTPNSARD